MNDKYINERRKLYPENWDHIEERIKIRLLAQKKLEICSERIEENLKEIKSKNTGYPEKGFICAET